ncbi:hypothetical protein SUSAZ_07995 [Sulfolobus acidocaldarius SUSAZ]|nr:hypothetical protein SUSAZ_07995 [Sulfolobus acidocaldarius SUSAZ]
MISVLLLVSFLAYALAKSTSYPVLILSTISALSFWFAILLLIPERFYDSTFSSVKKGKAYWITFSSYLIFHSILYGTFLTVLLGYIGFYPYFSWGVGFAVPPSPIYFIYWVASSPAFWMFIGPYESDILPFTMVIGLILGLLLSANVQSIVELTKNVSVSRSRISSSIVAIPTLGMISGTACCISLPTVILLYVSLSIGAVTSVLPVLSSPVYFNFVYFGLPIFSSVILYYNLVELRRINRKVCELK